MLRRGCNHRIELVNCYLQRVSGVVQSRSNTKRVAGDTSNRRIVCLDCRTKVP
jgi:hypothetical protein